MVTIKQLPNNRCVVKATFGTYSSTSGIKTQDAEAYIVRLITSRILHAAQFKAELLLASGARGKRLLDPAVIQYRLSNAHTWSLAHLRKVLRTMELDLLAILPAPSSPYYQQKSQIIFDVIDWLNPLTPIEL